MISITYKVLDVTGIHARPATKLVAEAAKFNSEIKITVSGTTVDCKSIMGVLSLGISKGETVVVTINGVDEEEAALGLKQMVNELKVAREV